MHEPYTHFMNYVLNCMHAEMGLVIKTCAGCVKTKLSDGETSVTRIKTYS